MDFVAFDTLTAAQLDDIVENVEALAAGTGLNDGVVTPDKIATGAGKVRVNGDESRSNVAYGALATAQAVTVTIGANGLALVSTSVRFFMSSASDIGYLSFAVSGANTIAVSDDNSIISRAHTTGTNGLFGRTILLTGLTPGSTTFTVQVRNSTGTLTCSSREISVVPL